MSIQHDDFESLTRPDWAALVPSAMFMFTIALVSLFGFVLPDAADFFRGERQSLLRPTIVFLFFVFAPIAGMILSTLHTRIDLNQDSLTKRRLFRSEVINWSDVVSIQRTDGSWIELSTERGKVIIHLHLFQNSEALSDFIEKRVNGESCA